MASLTSDSILLPMEAGEVVLLDNMMLHTSGQNTSGKPRRGFSIWYTNYEPPLCQIFPTYLPHSYVATPTSPRSPLESDP